jgi:hypothetical protein
MSRSEMMPWPPSTNRAETFSSLMSLLATVNESRDETPTAGLVRSNLSGE